MKSRLLSALAGALLCSIASQASAALYGTDSSGSLFKIDETTGSSTLVASSNPNASLGLAYNSLTGVMYSIGLFNGNLSTINLSTGATTFVGNNNFPMTGLTFSQDFSTLYSLASNGGSLLAVNPTTAAATVIGATNPSLLDLATNSSGALFGGGFGGIYSIDPLTGATTLIGGTLTWTSIAFDASGNLYGIEISTDALYKINASTGAATLVGGAIGGDVRGLAFEISAAVPEPSTWAMMILGFAGVGYMTYRRKRQTTALA
jgi:hypothetical protein